MLAAILKAGIVMPKILKRLAPANANTVSTIAVVRHATRAVRNRCSGVSPGVIARNVGAVASGSTITNSELSANRMYSDSVTLPELKMKKAK